MNVTHCLCILRQIIFCTHKVREIIIKCQFIQGISDCFGNCLYRQPLSRRINRCQRMQMLYKFFSRNNLWMFQCKDITAHNSLPPQYILLAGLQIIFDIRHIEISQITLSCTVLHMNSGNRHITFYMQSLWYADYSSMYCLHLIDLYVRNRRNILPFLIFSWIMCYQIIYRIDI